MTPTPTVSSWVVFDLAARLVWPLPGISPGARSAEHEPDRTDG